MTLDEQCFWQAAQGSDWKFSSLPQKPRSKAFGVPAGPRDALWLRVLTLCECIVFVMHWTACLLLSVLTSQSETFR